MGAAALAVEPAGEAAQRVGARRRQGGGLRRDDLAVDPQHQRWAAAGQRQRGAAHRQADARAGIRGPERGGQHALVGRAGDRADRGVGRVIGRDVDRRAAPIEIGDAVAAAGQPDPDLCGIAGQFGRRLEDHRRVDRRRGHVAVERRAGRARHGITGDARHRAGIFLRRDVEQPVGGLADRGEAHRRAGQAEVGVGQRDQVHRLEQAAVPAQGGRRSCCARRGRARGSAARWSPRRSGRRSRAPSRWSRAGGRRGRWRSGRAPRPASAL